MPEHLLNNSGDNMINSSIVSEYCNDFQDYLKDESRHNGHAESISFPRSTEDISAVMRNMHKNKIPVTIQGARTGLSAGAVPYGGHILNLSRMDKICSLRQDEEGHFYLTVQAGAVLSQVRKMIENRDFPAVDWSDEAQEAYKAFLEAPLQFFSPDPTESSATIAGMVACNASGARSYLYGPTRNSISAIRLVLADGDVLHIKRGEIFAKNARFTLTTESGQKLDIQLPDYKMPQTKNVAGYYVKEDLDAIDLFIGSDGTLAIISEIELMLQAAPKFIWGVCTFLDSEEQAVSFVSQLKKHCRHIASIEYFDRFALQILRDQQAVSSAFSRLPILPDNMGAVVYCELHCNELDLAHELVLCIGQAIEEADGDENKTWVATNNTDLENLLFFRHAVPESVNMLIDQKKQQYPEIAKLGTDISVPNPHLPDIIGVYRQTLAACGLQTATWGHIGDNHLHMNIIPNNADEYHEGLQLYQKWIQKALEMGGTVTAEHGIGKLKTKYLAMMFCQEELEQMIALKKTFDPLFLLGRDNIFNMPTNL